MLSPKIPMRLGFGRVLVLDGSAARLLLGEQHVLLRVELVDALHRTHVDARSILHVDAGFGDDGESGHGQLLMKALGIYPTGSQRKRMPGPGPPLRPLTADDQGDARPAGVLGR